MEQSEPHSVETVGHPIPDVPPIAELHRSEPALRAAVAQRLRASGLAIEEFVTCAAAVANFERIQGDSRAEQVGAEMKLMHGSVAVRHIDRREFDVLDQRMVEVNDSLPHRALLSRRVAHHHAGGLPGDAGLESQAL